MHSILFGTFTIKLDADGMLFPSNTDEAQVQLQVWVAHYQHQEENVDCLSMKYCQQAQETTELR